MDPEKLRERRGNDELDCLWSTVLSHEPFVNYIYCEKHFNRRTRATWRAYPAK
jgi:hypothetical protein